MMRRSAFVVIAVAIVATQGSGPTVRFGFGRPATDAEIAAWNISVRPDGKGLPAGSGTAREGAVAYASRCAVCHGATGREGPAERLVDPEPRVGFPFGRDPTLVKIGRASCRERGVGQLDAVCVVGV